MSFWSWIGLVEKKDVIELQSNINTLIEQNQQLREDNKKICECVGAVKDKCLEEITQQFNMEYNRINKMFQNTDTQINNLKEVIEQIQERINEINEFQNTYYSDELKYISNLHNSTDEMFSKLQNMITDEGNRSKKILEEKNMNIIDSIQKYQNIYVENTEKLLEEMRKDNTYIEKDLNEKNSSLIEMKNQMNVLGDSIQNLWTATKLIWADSVLSDLDSIS